MFAVSRHGDLPVGPLAGQVDADTCNNGWPVLQAEGGEVQTAGEDETQKNNRCTSEQRGGGGVPLMNMVHSKTQKSNEMPLKALLSIIES